MKKYLKFNGSSGLVTFNDNNALDADTSDFSVCLWLYANSVTGTQCLLDKYQGSLVGWQVLLSGSTIRGILDDTDLSTIDNTISIRKWYHIALTCDRNANGIMYVNAVGGAPTSIAASSLTISNAQALILGAKVTPADYANVLLDDIRIYKSILTGSEIKEIHSGGVGSKYKKLSTGKAASFALNCDGTLVDSVGGLTGTITGGVTYVDGGVPFRGTRNRYKSGYRAIRDRY